MTKYWKNPNLTAANKVTPAGVKDQIAYNDPTGEYLNEGVAPSSVDAHTGGRQIHTEYWIKKALIEEVRDTIYGQFADTTVMPKHYGKKLAMYHYLPILDDRNINDQGIAADGVTKVNGNLYGSSRDIGKITDMLPMGNEAGGRFNRIGVSRKTIEGEIFKLQFFMEWNKDALDFDTDSELYGHMSRETVRLMNRLSEDLIQMDVIHGAGVNYFCGNATSRLTMSGEACDLSDPTAVNREAVAEVTYKDLQKLSMILDKNRCPMKTTIITGSRMQDTRVISAARYMIVGTDVVPTLQQMTDHFNNPAFIDIAHYAYSGAGDGGKNYATGEIGKAGKFRFIQYLDQMFWEAEGAVATTNPNNFLTATNKAGEERYNVYPMVVIGEGSFSNVGFATDGKNTKFKIKHSFPGDDISYSAQNPYGNQGFMSCQFYHGLLITRPERLAVLHTLARA